MVVTVVVNVGVLVTVEVGDKVDVLVGVFVGVGVEVNVGDEVGVEVKFPNVEASNLVIKASWFADKAVW